MIEERAQRLDVDFLALQEAHGWLFSRRKRFWELVDQRLQGRIGSRRHIALPDAMFFYEPGDYAAARDAVAHGATEDREHDM